MDDISERERVNVSGGTDHVNRTVKRGINECTSVFVLPPSARRRYPDRTRSLGSPFFPTSTPAPTGSVSLSRYVTRRLLSDEERLTSKQPWDSRPCLLWLRAGSPLIEQARGGLYPRCCARLRPGKWRNNKDTEIFIKSMLERRQTSRPPKNKSSEELAAAKTRRFSPSERTT